MVFLSPDDTTATPSRMNGASNLNDSTMLPSPSPEAVTPQRVSTATPVGSVSRPESHPAESKHLGDTVESAHNPATSGQQSTVAAAASGVANVIPTSSAELKAQLAEAKATISKLRQQAEQGLRQRKSDAVNQDSKERITMETTGMGVQQAPAGGVPVQIVAGLCLLSFLLAYFFF